jgi:hypothetical protein
VNIFLLTETESGCYKWRGAIPAKYLRRRGHTVQIFSDEIKAYEAPDVMVFFRAHNPDVHKLVAFCKRNSIRVVFDTDDALDLIPRENLNYKGIQKRLDIYEFMIREADVVTTTTPLLAADLRKRNPNVAILPNSADPEEWRALPRSGPPRIGWNGSATHFHDLSVALAAVRELQRRRPFTFVLQGIGKLERLDDLYAQLTAEHGKPFANSPLGKSIKHFQAELAGIQYEFHPIVPIAEHARTVCDLDLDIGIAPLVEDNFNQRKSCIKYYEYAMSGAVTVASRVLPYSAEVPLTAKNNRDSWKQALESALDSDRSRLAREQREWVLEHRNMERNVELWERVYQGEVAQANNAHHELVSVVD